MEEWRAIDGYPAYEVGDRGRVRRCRRDGHRVLKPMVSTNGYFQISVYSGGRGRRVLVHSLVAAAFLGPRPHDKREINHRNGNKHDNVVGNLEYVTRQENKRHAAAAGLCARGERNAATSLTDADVAQMKARLRAGWPQVAVAARYGVGRSLISRVATSTSWGWLDPAPGEFGAYVIRGRRTAGCRWRVAGCADTLAAAALAATVMKDGWYELRVERAYRDTTSRAETACTLACITKSRSSPAPTPAAAAPALHEFWTLFG
jgi:hypothetical protein